MEDKENNILNNVVRRSSVPSVFGSFLRRPLAALVPAQSDQSQQGLVLQAPIKRTKSLPVILPADHSSQKVSDDVEMRQPREVLSNILEEDEGCSSKLKKGGAKYPKHRDVAPKGDLWLKLYEPYLEESVRLQVLKEAEMKAYSDLSCSKGMRAVLVDWLAMLQRFLDQRVDTFRLSVRIIDDVLDKCYVKPENLQLVALAAIWIASKIEGRHDIMAHQLVTMSKQSYTVRLLNRTEVAIMKALQFRLPYDTPASLITYHVTKLAQRDQVRHVASLFLDAGMLNWDVSCTRGSYMASAATLCALILLDIPQVCLTSHYKPSLVPCWCGLSEKDPAFVPFNVVRYLCLKMACLAEQVLDPHTKFKGIKENYRHLHLYRERLPQVTKIIESVHPPSTSS